VKEIKVTNLLTGEEQTFYDTIPSEAVINAYLKSIGCDESDYQKRYLELYSQLTWGDHTVALEDFCVFHTTTE